MHQKIWDQKAGTQVSLETKSEAHVLMQSEGTSHMCGHRPLTKKQKTEAVGSAVGFVLIQILSSHATWGKPFTLTSGSGYLVYSVKNVLITSMCKHVLDAGNTVNSQHNAQVYTCSEGIDSWESTDRTSLSKWWWNWEVMPLGSGGWRGPRPRGKVRLTKEVDSLEELGEEGSRIAT